MMAKLTPRNVRCDTLVAWRSSKSTSNIPASAEKGEEEEEARKEEEEREEEEMKKGRDLGKAVLWTWKVQAMALGEEEEEEKTMRTRTQSKYATTAPASKIHIFLSASASEIVLLYFLRFTNDKVFACVLGVFYFYR